MENKYDIALVGLAVMGENLVMNMESKGFSVCVYNRTKEKTEKFINGRARNKNIKACYCLKELVDNLKSPRKIMLMVKAGNAVDEMINSLIPLLSYGDIIIDGGNSHYTDTIRRTEFVESKGLLYVGTGVSGGEEGALKGPSMMPGGSEKAWDNVKPIFKAICAKTNDGFPCCDWLGNNGAGHFVKMVHNGIEYGDMELICEAYQIMRVLLKMSPLEMSKVFAKWNDGVLKSYLIEITRDILAYKENDKYLIDSILDKAGQKGTGKWTSVASLDEGVSLTLIAEAVFARCLSAIKDERVIASKILSGSDNKSELDTKLDKEEILSYLCDALYVCKIVSYAQGFALLKSASKTYNWNLDYGKIALLWRGGCIIRSVFLNDIKLAFDKNPNLENLMIDDCFAERIKNGQKGLRKICSLAVEQGVSVPAFFAAISYFDGYRCENSPANLLQAQRDYFGAHTYERVDSERGKYFHTNWTGTGGDTASSTYNV